VSLLNSIDRAHVLTAMETWDTAGGANFLLVRGSAPTHVLRYGGREYDAGAIAGIAHGLATCRTLSPDDIPVGAAAAARTLTRLGFEIRDDSPPSERVPGSSARPRRTASSGSRTSSTSSRPAAKPRVAASDRPVNLCPSCFLAMPATGVCDNCG